MSLSNLIPPYFENLNKLTQSINALGICASHVNHGKKSKNNSDLHFSMLMSQVLEEEKMWLSNMEEEKLTTNLFNLRSTVWNIAVLYY